MKRSKTNYLYLRLAEKLAYSLSLSGNFLTILTHQSNLLKSIANSNINNLEIVEIENCIFSQIPKSAKFYQAHAKLDCFKYFSSLERNEPLFLIDCDVIQIGDFPEWFYNEEFNS